MFAISSNFQNRVIVLIALFFVSSNYESAVSAGLPNPRSGDSGVLRHSGGENPQEVPHPPADDSRSRTCTQPCRSLLVFASLTISSVKVLIFP